MTIVNFGIGDELLYYVELEESMESASEIAGIFMTPAFDELEYLLALNVYTEESYATVIDKEGNILLKPHYEYSMMITDNYLDSLAQSDLKLSLIHIYTVPHVLHLFQHCTVLQSLGQISEGEPDRSL